jgi:molybdopterin biosynthesis enzyme MoaB
MPKLDPNRPFIPVRIAVLTVSDNRELADDKSGATLSEMFQAAGIGDLHARYLSKTARTSASLATSP